MNNLCLQDTSILIRRRPRRRLYRRTEWVREIYLKREQHDNLKTTSQEITLN